MGLLDRIGVQVEVTGMTGVAAMAINGNTLHSFAGIGIGEWPLDRLLGKILKSRFLRIRWQQTSTLVIDEISMLDQVKKKKQRNKERKKKWKQVKQGRRGLKETR